MKNYTIRLLEENELDLALNFAWPIAQQHKYFYFPFYNSFDELKVIFSRFFHKKGLYLIGLLENNDIVALFPLVFRDDDDIGSWDKGIYINDNKISYDIAMNFFRTYIKDNLGFSGKQIYCGISNDYIDAVLYFKKEVSEILEETYITSFDFKEYHRINHNVENLNFDPTIKILDLKEYLKSNSEVVINPNNIDIDIINAYFKYHDIAYPGYYWTSERIKKHFQDFRIIIAISYSSEHNFIIHGAMFIREIEGVGDIYGLSDMLVNNTVHINLEMELTSLTLREAMLNKAIQNSRCEGIKSMMFFCEDINDYNLALSKGFENMGNYTVYLWKI